MAGSFPSRREIEETVTRLEERHRDHPLFAHYTALCERFDSDLSDPRDRALARSAALMLIKAEVDGEAR